MWGSSADGLLMCFYLSSLCACFGAVWSRKRGGAVPGSCVRVWSAASRPLPVSLRRSSVLRCCWGTTLRWSSLWCRAGPAPRPPPGPAADSDSCNTTGHWKTWLLKCSYSIISNLRLCENGLVGPEPPSTRSPYLNVCHTLQQNLPNEGSDREKTLVASAQPTLVYLLVWVTL